MPGPAIVLVHGAFVDASSWRPVHDRLVGDGHAVLAPPNPRRGLPYDAPHTETGRNRGRSGSGVKSLSRADKSGVPAGEVAGER